MRQKRFFQKSEKVCILKISAKKVKMHTYPQLEEPSSLTGQKLFYRRANLSSAIRLKIATIALIFQIHGTISALSRRYHVSRQFVYDLRGELSRRLAGLFEDRSAGFEVPMRKRQLLRTILYLRLVGKCSLHAISHLLSAPRKPIRLPG